MWYWLISNKLDFYFTDRFIKSYCCHLLTFTGMAIACIDFELSNILISLSASSIVIVLKEKHSLVSSEAIAIMLGCYLYLYFTIAFWQRINIFKRRNFKINYSIWEGTVQFTATSSLFVIRVSSFWSSFILSEDRTLFDKKGLTVFKKRFQLYVFFI